jgi:formylglycine-generating enzyme required for sulfatase activity
MKILLSLLLLFKLSDDPPGTIMVKGLYVDKNEISNIAWKEFLYYKSLELDSAELRKFFPDTSNIWFEKAENNYKPIVLISYEQANEFCKWRSQLVSKGFGKKINYRLMKPSEWKAVAENEILNNRRFAEKDLARTRKILQKNSADYVLFENTRTGNKIYNLFDNVSEMTLEKGVSMGLSNVNLNEIGTNLIQESNYTSPSKYLGFRCVAEYK